MNIISLEQANTIIAAIFIKSRELNLRPMSAVGVEPGNIVKAFAKEDHASALRLEMALGKTYAALALVARQVSCRCVLKNDRCLCNLSMKPLMAKFLPRGVGD